MTTWGRRAAAAIVLAGVAILWVATVDAQPERRAARGRRADAGVVLDASVPGGADAGAADAGVDASLEEAGVVDAGVVVEEPPPVPMSAVLERVEIGEAVEEAIGVPAEATDTVVRTLLGLVCLLAIAYLASHRAVQRLERMLGITHVVTAGFPFVALGLLAQAPGIQVVTDGVVEDITPVLQFGLGWIGFLTGYQFDLRAIERMPRGSLQVVFLMAGLPFVAVAGVTAAALTAFGFGDDPAKLLRDAALLGAAGALTSPSIASLVRVRGFSTDDVDLARSLGLLDDIAGVLGLMVLGAFVRPPIEGTTWSLPGTGWLLFTIGLAVVLGILVHLLLGYAERGADRSALLIGSIAFAGGIAGVLQLSPLVVCCLAGAILRNLRTGGDSLGPVLERLERPIYLVFLAVAGALWRIEDARGWLLVPLFVVGRTIGRLVAARMARRIPLALHDSELVRSADAGLVVAPMGALSIALMVSAQTLYVSRHVHLFVTAVLGAAMVLEVLVQISARGRAALDADAVGRTGAP